MTDDLADKQCVPCQGGIPPLAGDGLASYAENLPEGWDVIDNTKLRREYTFEDFKENMAFVNDVAEIAENEGHHPDLHIYYNKLTVELLTHKIGGLHENDFIMAAKIEERFQSTAA